MRARHVQRGSRLRVAITDARGRPVASGGLGRWLERAAPRTARGLVSVALVTDGEIRRLNREHRGKDVPTDVLSFPVRPQALGPRPHRDAALASPGPRALSPGPLLGDLAIATGVARRQAREHGHALTVELRVLALHGLLHLLGYDHETDRGRMARTEARLGRRAGLPAALIGRTPRPHR
jgi:probable rRNA maturation factor